MLVLTPSVCGFLNISPLFVLLLVALRFLVVSINQICFSCPVLLLNMFVLLHLQKRVYSSQAVVSAVAMEGQPRQRFVTDETTP